MNKKGLELCITPKLPRWQHRRENLLIDARLAAGFWMRGVIRTHRRQQGLRGPEPQVSGERRCVGPRWTKKRKGQKMLLHAWESLCGPLPMSLKKLHLEGTQTQRDRTLNAAFHCGFCIHLHPQSGGTSASSLSHLTGMRHVERWSLCSHARPWDFHKRGMRDRECLKTALAEDQQQVQWGSRDGEITRNNQSLQEISGWRWNAAHWGDFCAAEVLASEKWERTEKNDEIRKAVRNIRGSSKSARLALPRSPR